MFHTHITHTSLTHTHTHHSLSHTHITHTHTSLTHTHHSHTHTQDFYDKSVDKMYYSNLYPTVPKVVGNYNSTK